MMNTFICLALLAFVASCHAVKYYPVVLNNLGCWKDTENRAIPTREGDPILDGSSYQSRVNAIAKCARVAHNHGDDVFAIQHGGWCASSVTARSTYRRYGVSYTCVSDGKGSSWRNQVYEIASISTVSLTNLGCWADGANRAIPTLEGLDPILDGNYQSRAEAIAKCVQAAHARGYTVIALQHGGWCAGSRDALMTYKKYGASHNCGANGKGGSWANQVYRIDVEVTTTY